MQGAQGATLPPIATLSVATQRGKGSELRILADIIIVTLTNI